MSARPVLGVSCCNRPVGAELGQTVMNRFVASAIAHADTAVLLVPSMPALMRAEEVVDRLDGLLLTGSPSNVAPARYGPPLDDAPGPFDPDRDEMTARLIAAMLDAGKPVFGVCRGFQELNVAFGGSLRRDVATHPGLLPHHAPAEAAYDAMFAHGHSVRLVPGGVLARAYGKETLEVNSVHFQGVDRLAPGLRVEATAPDGVVEAVSAEVNGAPVLAVQWHPEWRPEENPESRTFFSLLARALRGRPIL